MLSIFSFSNWICFSILSGIFLNFLIDSKILIIFLKTSSLSVIIIFDNWNKMSSLISLPLEIFNIKISNTPLKFNELELNIFSIFISFFNISKFLSSISFIILILFSQHILFWSIEKCFLVKFLKGLLNK